MARGHQIENSTWEIYFRVISNNDTRGALLFLGAIDFPVGFGGVHYLCDQVVHAVSAKWGHLHVAVRPHRRCNFLTLLWRDRGTVENLSKVEKHVNNALYNGISSYEQIWCLKKDLGSTKTTSLYPCPSRLFCMYLQRFLFCLTSCQVKFDLTLFIIERWFSLYLWIFGS